MAVTPKPPAFDAEAFDNALDKRVRKTPSTVTVPEGAVVDGVVKSQKVEVVEGLAAYPSIQKFAPWKRWVDSLRDSLEALRLGVFGPDGLKNHVDTLDARERAHFATTDGRLDALEAAHRPFGSGSG